MSVFRLITTAIIALLLTSAFGYFLWIEVPQFLFFKSTPALVESVEPVCFLSSEGQASAADCATVRARAGKKRVYQMYRTTLRYQSPADDREHIETIITRALGPIRPGATWKLLAHTAEPNRIQPVNEAGRSILFGVSVLLFVTWFRSAFRKFVRRAIQGRQGLSPATSAAYGPQHYILGGVAFAVFFIFFLTIRR